MTNARTLPVGEGNEEIQGAGGMIAATLRAEADEYVEGLGDEVDEDGHRLLVRNGRARSAR